MDNILIMKHLLVSLRRQALKTTLHIPSLGANGDSLVRFCSPISAKLQTSLLNQLSSNYLFRD